MAENPLFSSAAEVHIDASPDEVYAVVGDLARSGEWSPECVGGAWISGAPGAVGAVFRGENVRAEEVVSWAPVVRGTWFTESEVVTAEPGRVFAWSMRTKAGVKQDSVWTYDITPAERGCVLAHRFRMGTATEGIRGITSEMDESQRTAFFTEWGEKVAGDLAVTLNRIKGVIENGATNAA